MKHEIHLLEDDEFDLDDDLPSELDIEALREQACQTGREYRGLFSGKAVRLAPDVAAVFDSSEAVNEALRTLIRLAREVKHVA